MRARGIKPGFFKNEVLGNLPPLARILFAGLWCLADREGRLEDRPTRIKAEVLPYDDCDVDELLDLLATSSEKFIIRYERDGGSYIWIPTFAAHQNPHHREPASKIPPFAGKPRAGPGKAQGEPQARPGNGTASPRESPADSGLLTPDSIPSGGTPASGAAPVENSEDFREIDFEEDQQGDPPEKDHTPAQQLVAFYADEHRRTLGSGPTRRQIGILADIVGEKLKGGASPDAVKLAIRSMVRKGKGPSTLPAFVDEAEVATRAQPGPGPDLGPPPTEEEKAASAQAAKATNAMVQALVRKKAMPT